MTDRGVVRNVTLRPLVDRFITERAKDDQTSLANTINISVMEGPKFNAWVFKDRTRDLELEIERLSQICDAYEKRVEELLNDKG